MIGSNGSLVLSQAVPTIEHMFDHATAVLDGPDTADAVLAAPGPVSQGPVSQGPVSSALAGSGSGSMSFDVAFVGFESAVSALVAAGVPADAEVLVAVRACLDRVAAVLVEAEGRFDAFELWRDEGAGSMRGWLTDACGLSRKAASAEVRRVERLQAWPELSDAWRAGRLSGAQVDCVVAAVPNRFTALFAEHAAAVVEVLAPLDAASCEVAMRRWVRCAEATDGAESFRDRPSGVHLDRLLDGHVALSGDLCPADAAIIAAAIADFDVPDPVDDDGQPIGEPRTRARRHADALVAACRFASTHRQGAGDAGRFLPHVSLIVDIQQLRTAALRGAGVTTAADLDALATTHRWSAAETAWFTDALQSARTGGGIGVTFDGLELDPTAISLLTCDSVVQRVLTAGDKVLNMGRETRTATAAQRRAIITRDRHCRAPGCRTGPQHCDVHHIDHWINGGRTDVHRMVLLCGTHHRQFHRPGHRMELDDAVFTVHSPKGWSRSTTPDRPEQPRFSPPGAASPASSISP